MQQMSAPAALAHDGRARLYALIDAEPGLHVAALGRRLGVQTSTVQWHLRALERAGLASTRRVAGRLVAAATRNGTAGTRLAKHRALLRHDRSHLVATAIAAHGGVTITDLDNLLDVPADALRWHAVKLRRAGLVRVVRDGGAYRHFATSDLLSALAPDAAMVSRRPASLPAREPALEVAA